MLTVSVIVPVLNEASVLARTLEAFSDAPVDEVLVVDGGSSDGTPELLESLPCRVIRTSRPGRALQLNTGAREASGELLLFLHADTFLPDTSLVNMMEAMERDADLVGGGFARRFDSPSLFLGITSRLAGLRSRYFGLFLGDQGIFVRADVFKRLGGFDETMGPGEDLDFSVRLRHLGKTLTVSPPVVSSARRFEEHGPFRQTWRDWQCACRIVRSTEGRPRI